MQQARQAIEAAGYGEFFVHNLGHGVGLEIHEAPTLSPDSKDILVGLAMWLRMNQEFTCQVTAELDRRHRFIKQESAEKLTTGPTR